MTLLSKVQAEQHAATLDDGFNGTGNGRKKRGQEAGSGLLLLGRRFSGLDRLLIGPGCRR